MSQTTEQQRLSHTTALYPAVELLLDAQRKQYAHDLKAHRDILSLDTHSRIKHMTLHFLKYAGKLAQARNTSNVAALGSVLLDTFIICLATANTLNVRLGSSVDRTALTLDELAASLGGSNSGSGDIFDRALTDVVTIAGRMAKAIESTDHLERGDPRAELESLVTELAGCVLALVGELQLPLTAQLRKRWRGIEAKSIFNKRSTV